MKKVILLLKGGLGNQLFSYAAARRLALANEAELVIDTVGGFSRDTVYQRNYQLSRFPIPARAATPAERLEPFPRLRHKLLRRLNRGKAYENRSFIQEEAMEFDARLLKVRVKGTVRLEGYWQSEGYFKDIEEVVRRDLAIRPPTDAVNCALSEHIRGVSSVAVHVRFFDLPAVEGGHNASGDYYERAVARMEALRPGAHYFIFSDKPEAARARIPLPDERITLVSHNVGDAGACDDLWLMSQCRDFIVANSTFSWWGAWLGSQREKIVVAPGFVMTGKMCWGFEGLLPPEWILL